MAKQNNINWKNGVTKVIDSVIKSECDDRVYRGLILKNELKVLLISDPKTDKSSASLDVGIGGMCDPWEFPGLAHFCEHMLFLGTEKYPDENDFSKYLSENAGNSNAYTDLESTNYHFEVGPIHLEGALDRFSWFFKAPMFNAPSVSREVRAVHSEHQMNLQNDMWRLNEMQKTTSDPKHPISKFTTGNLDTLETIPLSKGLDVREALLEFHKKYYSSNLMCLTVLSKESLDELSGMVVEMFGGIENKNVERPKWNDKPLGPENLKISIKVVPIKDNRTLEINWLMPDFLPYYKTKPGLYINHLIGHEGYGSLLSKLKRKGWVNTLSSGEKHRVNGFSIYCLKVDLTEEGLDKINEIITACYDYINLLKKHEPEEWIFNECKKVNEQDFRFKDKEKPDEYVTSVSSKMQWYPIEEVLFSSYIYSEYRPSLIKEFLSYLVPDNMRILLIAQVYRDVCKLTEKYYGTEYLLENLQNSYIEQWKDESHLDPDLQLPEPNPFIPDRFDLIPVSENKNEVFKAPTIVKEGNFSTVWYCQDDEFKLPKTCLSIQFYSPSAYYDPISANLTQLMVKMFRDSVKEYVYSASLAGLAYGFSNNIYGVQLNIEGFNDKLMVYLKELVQRLINFEPKQERFDILLENMVRSFKNFEADASSSHALYYFSSLISQHSWLKYELLEATKYLTLDKLKDFTQRFFATFSIEAFIYGNTTAREAVDMVDCVEKMIVSKFQSAPMLESQHRKMRAIDLPMNCSYKYSRMNHFQKSSCVHLYLQCFLDDCRLNVVLELFGQLINEPCYAQLRTQQQLGYVVNSDVREYHGVHGLLILVQTEKPVDLVEERIELFLANIKSYLVKMDDSDFEKHKQSLAEKRLEKPKEISEQNDKYWNEIFAQLYHFNRDEVEVEQLKKITKEDLLQFYEDYVSLTGQKRRKVSVQIVSKLLLDQSADNSTITGTGATDDSNEMKKESLEGEKKEDDVDFGLIDKVDLNWTNIEELHAFKKYLTLSAQPQPQEKPVRLLLN